VRFVTLAKSGNLCLCADAHISFLRTGSRSDLSASETLWHALSVRFGKWDVLNNELNDLEIITSLVLGDLGMENPNRILNVHR
jgi:hypothetical protein